MTCAFVDCSEVSSCCLPGGCVRQRFGSSTSTSLRRPTERELPKAKALNGTKPRAVRDPRFIKRRRKALF